MSSVRFKSFAKTRSCPTASELIAYQLGRVSDSESKLISSHLMSCDFCGAEAHLLLTFQAPSPVSVAPEMPRSLRLLAESLLKNIGPGCKVDLRDTGSNPG